MRAPLARIMGLEYCLNDYSNSEAEIHEMLKHIQTSAAELDNILRKIINKTEKVRVKYNNEFESIASRR